MKTTFRKAANLLVSFVVSITMLFPGLQSSSVSVQAQAQDSIHRDRNAETGKVALISGADNKSISVLGPSAVNMTPEAQSLALVQHFASEFGLTDPAKELELSEINQPSADRVVSKYQQVYQGVPVMAGELIVNASKAGELISMNGEVLQGLSLDTKPELTVEAAIETAKQGMVKWYGGEVTDYTSTQSSLWIFDETLLRPSIRPANLVWRVEMVSTKDDAPIRELVLVDAKMGNVIIHFNQIDNAWTEVVKQNVPTSPSLVIPESKTSVNPISVQTVVSDISAEIKTLELLATTNYYVNIATGNDSDSCTSVATPCQHIQEAINKAASEDVIIVAAGTYTGSGAQVAQVDKSITLSGGWNDTFNVQDGYSIIDGGNTRKGIYITSPGSTINISRFLIQNSTYGLHVDGSNLTVQTSQSTLQLNGIGILNDGGTLNFSRVALINNNGNGIYNSSGNVTFTNSTISGNPGGLAGSAISNVDGHINIQYSTITKNSGDYSIYSVNGNAQIEIGNSILSGNVNVYNEFFANITSDGYNIFGSSGQVFNSSFVLQPSDQINDYPRLDVLSPNGDLPLIYGSPAIDAANPAICPPTDQRGMARPDGAACDIGAYEGSVPWTPTPLVNTYTAGGTSSLPGSLLCNQTQPNCTNGSNLHADVAHRYAIGTYNLYAIKHLRDSIDNHGILIKSSVHYCAPYLTCPYANAFWNGTQMVYGDAFGFPLADDVVAHELTHGVTEYESNLFYFYQSGAINESLSDVWGEYYDQTNGLGTDTPAVKWLMGEDVSGSTPIRSMSNPPTYGDPDKMTSANYEKTDIDNGGVHTNSGVNNKAVFLMVDGGTFNSKTISALGWDKTAAIYYEANTNLLSSGADYSDLYYALQQACANLRGQLGITLGDCQQVKNALDAVEMNSQPVTNFNPDAPLCAVGLYPNIPLFVDNMESGTGKWTMTGAWSLQSGYASSPSHMLYGDDIIPSNVSVAAMTTGVALPVSSNLFLHFKHAFAFEYDAGGNYDGGVLEYSNNNGASWVDASPKFIDGQNYKGTILNYPGSTNALKGRSAFVGDSHGYVSSRYNLTSLGGQTVKFRWRFATDNSYYYLGWMVDDVQIYTCAIPPAPTVTSSVRTNADPTGATNVKFTVTFSQSVTGVDAGDFSLTTSGVSGPTVSGVSGSGSVYTVEVNTGSGSGTIHLNVVDNDSIINGFANPLGGYGAGNGNFTSGETYTITKTWIFGDVPNTYWAHSYIERLYNAGVTGGCSTIPLNYCPSNSVTRAQMAIFLLRGIHGKTYAPLAATGTVFTDVSASSFGAAWIEQLALEGITAGCGVSIYCPDASVTRAQMAIFLLRSKHGSTYAPSSATGTVFTDVSASSFAAAWIEQLALEGVTSGCGSGKYCPNGSVTRAEMAVFLVKTFNLP